MVKRGAALSNYYNRRRLVSDSVRVGNNEITVEAVWNGSEEDERVDVTITVDDREHHFADVGDSGLLALAEVFTTVNAMVCQESVEVQPR